MTLPLTAEGSHVDDRRVSDGIDQRTPGTSDPGGRMRPRRRRRSQATLYEQGLVSLLGIPVVPCLTRLPLSLSVDWISGVVTTATPRLVPYEEWRLSLDIEARAPIRAAVLWYLHDEVSWGLAVRGHRAH
jgi:hypothetical protein